MAVCSLWHCPAGRPDWNLSSTPPCGVPTFLDGRSRRGHPAASPCSLLYGRPHGGQRLGHGVQAPPPGVRFEETRDYVEILRGMWDAGTAPFKYGGKHYSVKDVINVPPPGRRIPLGIGGGGDRMLDLTARAADEWNCPGALLGMYDERRAYLEKRLEKHGRDVRRTCQIVFAAGEEEPPAALAMFNPGLGLFGSADRMAERAAELKDAGVSGLFGIVLGRRGLDAMAEALPAVRAAVE